MAAKCPNCSSRSVSWRGGYYICSSCNGLGHHDPCIYCKHNVLVHHPSHADCADCNWSGDPYDLIEVEDTEE